MFNVCNQNQLETSRMPTNGSQSEVPTKTYLSVTFSSNIEKCTRYFISPLVVADIEYLFLGTPFFEKNPLKN